MSFEEFRRRRRMIAIVAAVAWVGTAVAEAASWRMQHSEGYRGDVLSIEIYSQGDGATAAMNSTWAFDETRFSVDAPVGPLTGSNGALCSLNGGAEISVLRLTASGTLPTTEQVVCTVPLRIRDNAPFGGSVVDASDVECSAIGTQSVDCSVIPGRVAVLDALPLSQNLGAPPAPPPALELNLLLAVGGPSVETVAEADYTRASASAPLAALREAPPIYVRPLLPRRLHDDILTQLGPTSPDGVLHRYVVAGFAGVAQRDAALKLAQHDPDIEAAYINERLMFPGQSLAGDVQSSRDKRAPAQSTGGKTTTVFPQYHRDVLGIDSAWQIAGGWGLVGIVDNGLYPTHPELRSFNGASFIPGGNYLPALSRNVAGQGQLESNLDEVQEGSVRPDDADAECDLDGDQWITPEYAGHGSHVAGLVSANAEDGVGVSGACKHCGIAMMKASRPECRPKLGGGHAVFSTLFGDAVPVGLDELRRHGTQVISLSFSSSSQSCFESNSTLCTALQAANADDVLVVVAAGNNLTPLQVPAYNSETLAVAGTNLTGRRWDLSAPPNSIQDCPYYPYYQTSAQRKLECGSNSSTGSLGSHGAGSLELSAPAQSIRSTTYPGWTWNEFTICGDGYGDSAANDGYGYCTGTSMSAPIAAGVLGMLRSVHPLLRSGDHPSDQRAEAIKGVRKLVAETATMPPSDPTLAPPFAVLPYGFLWSGFHGFGVPNPEVALDRLLGRALNAPIRNRVSPLFRLYSVDGSDYAAVATPQWAIALTLRQVKSAPKYRSTAATPGQFREGLPLRGYEEFPHSDAGSPRAAALILTTEQTPDGVALQPIPLFLLERQANGPTRDFILLSSASEVQTAVSGHGYSYLGRQGFIYPFCTTCSIPEGSQVLHQKCKTSASDCAVFLESERLAFESDGYTALFPGSAASPLGFAYPVAYNSADSDDLPDGAERVIGTSPMHADSDGDGMTDSQEYPLHEVPASDPCSGASPACPRSPNWVFGNGFEGDSQ